MKHTSTLIGIAGFGTFFALILGGVVFNFIYNENWLADGTEVYQCVYSSSVGTNCSENYDEYLHGLFWWGNLMGLTILITGSVITTIIYKKRPAVRAN